MRKLSAILLLFIFVFSQYTRQLSYLECKFSNTFKVSSAKCDCEKQAGFDKKDTNQAPVSNMHTHIHLDEYFITNEITFDPYFKDLNRSPDHLQPNTECKGCYSTPWEPPNT